MCRWMLYLGPEIPLADLLTRPTHSLIHQSFKAEMREEPLNGDGFGVAWYAPDISAEPAVFRSIQPAWSNQNLVQLARVTLSGTVLAHVRAATPGLPVVETNCHPFSVGPLSFMHNGYIPQFRDVRRALAASLSEDAYEAIVGTTDSEHVFALVRDHIANVEETGLDAMASGIEGAIGDVVALLSAGGIEEPCQLNLCISDGKSAVVSRFASHEATPNTLFVHAGARYSCVDGVCRMEDAGDGHTILVASEPLSDDAGWDPVEPGHLALIDANGRVEHRPISPSTGP